MGNDEDIKQGMKDKYWASLPSSCRNMHQCFLIQARISSSNDCQRCWHIKDGEHKTRTNHINACCFQSLLKNCSSWAWFSRTTYSYSTQSLYFYVPHGHNQQKTSTAERRPSCRNAWNVLICCAQTKQTYDDSVITWWSRHNHEWN